MKLICTNYDNLISSLTAVSSVVEDTLVPEDMKNIIFDLEKSEQGNKLTLFGATQLLTYKKFINPEVYELDMEDVTTDRIYLQIKAKELLGFLNTYKTLSRTVVDSVSFEINARGRIECTVVEKDKKNQEQEGSFLSDEDLGIKTYSSKWVFDNVPIKKNIMPFITQKAPEGDLTTIPTRNLKLYTKNLLPILQNGTNIYSYLIFDKDYVVSFHNAFTTMMISTVSENDVLSGLRLPFRAINFLDKVICADIESVVEIAKDEMYLYFKNEDCEAYLKYDCKLANYKEYINLFDKTNGIVLNRFYFKDVLKRLSLVNDAIEFKINIADSRVTLSNSKFTQEIDMENKKGFEGVDTITFNILPEVVNKAIICDDVANMSAIDGSDNVFVYYLREKNIITFSDSTGSWFSTVRVKAH